MFQKPAFGANTSAFGMSSTFGSPAASTSSPFGFKPGAAAGSFGAPPAFGAPAIPAPSTGLFGATNTTGGLFGATATPTAAPAFGATNTGFGFGNTNTSGGLFNTSGGGGLFQPQQNNTAFGAKPAAFGFGASSTPSAGGLFGSPAAPQPGGLFQQPGGLFANNTGSGFGAGAAAGTGHVKYSPLVGTDVVVKGGASQNINIKHHCITCMKEYEGKSLEELRLEDYGAGRRGPTAGGAFAFPDNKGLFNTGGTFGAAPATSAAPFGGIQPAQPGFGQTSTFSFGGATQTNTNTNTTSLFGAQKPAFGATSTAGTSLFGTPASTQASTFGTNTSTFGFGSNLQNQSTGGLFGAKPATTGFGAAASAGFGFGGGGALFNKPQQTQAPSFGAPQTGLGSMAGAFGTATSAAGGGLFGAGFGKPAPAPNASFGFGSTQPALGTGLNTGLGANAFAPKSFGGSMFPSQPNNTFRTGLDSGLGGGMFGNNTSGGLGLGASAANLSGAAGGVHAQILALAARPYGDQPLFKDLLPTSSTAEDILKPTNPVAQAAVLARPSAAYRVSSPPALRLAPRPRAHAHDKKSLFDGLEESDASLDDKLSLKPSRKRLVLRQNHRPDAHDAHDTPPTHYRSQEESEGERQSATSPVEEEKKETREEAERVKKNIDFATNLDMSSERQASWLGSSKPAWAEKEPATDEPAPRIYPNIDKDIQNEVSERRSSWLTTKTLRKPASTGTESAENSVRELGVTDRDADTLSLSEEEVPPPRPRAPHPAGVKCSRPGYYTIPSLEEITGYLRPDGTCKVPHLTIGRTNYGNVYFDSEIDVAGLDIDNLVHFLNKEVIIYPEDLDKPPVGQGLNRRAVVTLDRVWPRDKTERRPIDDPDRLQKMDYEGRLRRVCDKHDTKFIEYRPLTGSWVFRVEHFSKYGLSDSDEEDALPPTSAAPPTAPSVPKPLVSAPGLGGLGLASGGLGLSGGGLISSEDTIFALQQSSINLLSGASKAFEMDTAEENTESHSMYQDHRAFSVKSPTSELARLELRRSAHVQRMKASLYADQDMEEDVSVSTGDQLVPLAREVASTSVLPPRPLVRDAVADVTAVMDTEELQMKPLVVQPHTIVLSHHRKVPPFKHTIAGRLGAACVADMSVSHARLSRAGWGPGGTLVFVTTHRAISQLPAEAELSELSMYVAGRGEQDWSEPVVARLALGRSPRHYNVAESLGRQLSSLLPFSEPLPAESAPASDREGAGSSPGLRVVASPRSRLAALRQLVRDAEVYAHCSQPFGVSGAYCLEVWKLCEALWGADLENDGVPGTDLQSHVGRQRAFLGWLTAAGADLTEQQLAQPAGAEDEDESDGHSGRVWSLLVGGRVLAACREASRHGDLNMAAIIAQAGGDPAFKSLVSRQLSLWRECGASTLVSSRRRDALSLTSGRAPENLRHEHWLLALHATARYLCPQVPTLEQVVRRYEALFVEEAEGDDPGGDDPGVVDLARLPEREGASLPLPPYAGDYDITTDNATRALDLRYVLIRARALNARPVPRAEQYSPSPADHSLSFILGVWLGCPSAQSVVGAAAQLEAAGDWPRAAHALSYLPDRAARDHLIREMVSRHVPPSADDDAARRGLQLLRELRVPERWILLAQADRARYEHRPLACAQRLAEAGRYAAAHDILVDKLLPDAVLSDSVGRLAPLLQALRGRGAGDALALYAHVTDQVRELVSGGAAGAAGASGAALEALRPAIAAACRALDHLPTKTCAQACARAEMGARLAALAAAGGAPLPARLPPDTTAAARGQIAAELAEQAAELCIQPTPISI